MDGDAVRVELQRRAALLAAPRRSARPQDTHDLLAFTWAGASYRIDAVQVRETLAAGRLLRVPEAPTELLGACLVRSEVMPVLDLRPLLGLSAPAHDVERLVVLVGRSHSPVALAADTVERITAVRDGDLHRDVAGSALVEALGPDGSAVLDAGALLGLPPLFPPVEGP